MLTVRPEYSHCSVMPRKRLPGHLVLIHIGPWNIKYSHNPLEVCKKKNKSTLHMEQGLGWVVTAIGWVPIPRLAKKYRIWLVLTKPLLVLGPGT